MSVQQWMITRLSQLCFGVACLALLAMSLHIFVEFVGRLFGIYIDGTLEFTSFYYMIFAVFLGNSYTQYKNQHISTDVLTNLLSIKYQKSLAVISLILQMFFYSLLSYQTLLDSIDSYLSMEETMANFRFYIWPSKWALPLGFASLTLVVLLQFIELLFGKSLEITKEGIKE